MGHRRLIQSARSEQERKALCASAQQDRSYSMKRRGALTIAVLASATVMTGCYESADVTVHDGQYKGKNDPLLDARSTAEREEVLQKRFKLVQVDR
jgi:hypothetical protein